jgi:hypothetical protein
MDEQARRWQQRIDEAFPHGALMTEDSPDHGRTVTLACPRPEVVAMQGLSPVFFADFPEHDRNISGVITGWEPVQEEPCRVVRVTTDSGGEPEHDSVMLWSGNLSPAYREALRPAREESLRRSAEGTAFHGSAWYGRP